MPLCSYNKYDQSQGGYEEAVMMGDPPAKEYNTYMMQVSILLPLILVMMMKIMSILLKKKEEEGNLNSYRRVSLRMGRVNMLRFPKRIYLFNVFCSKQFS